MNDFILISLYENYTEVANIKITSDREVYLNFIQENTKKEPIVDIYTYIVMKSQLVPYRVFKRSILDLLIIGGDHTVMEKLGLGEIAVDSYQLKIFVSKIIFIINGTGGVGKDTFVKLYEKNIKSRFKNNVIVHNISTITPIRQMLEHCVDDINLRDEKTRQLLSSVKNALEEYNDYTTEYAAECIRGFIKSTEIGTLFIHLREPNLIDKLKDRCKETIINTILIDKSNVDGFDNESDDIDNIHNYRYDIDVINDTTIDDLEENAKYLIDCLYNKTL